MAATHAELAEDTAVYLLPRPTFETVDRGELFYVAGRCGMRRCTGPRIDDVAAALAWTREESRRRGLSMVEWWLGWSASRPTLGSSCSRSGSCRTSVPTLTGMTCVVAPPAAARGRGAP